jgi:hypothetical protein
LSYIVLIKADSMKILFEVFVIITSYFTSKRDFIDSNVKVDDDLTIR